MMITVDSDALAASVNRTMGWTMLKPAAPQGDEPDPPSPDEAPPQAMAEFALVPSSSYRFEYTSARYVRLCYLLERNGVYEAGELSAVHFMPEGYEGNPSEFEPPVITTEQSVSMGAINGLGVRFEFMHDPGTEGSTAKFALGFKITESTPAVHPRLAAAYMTVFPMEDF
jgi:hypothetical protein